MKYLFAICFTISITGVIANIQNVAKSYFNSEIAQTFARKWKPYAKLYENTMGFTLQEAFGHHSMNVYINRYLDPLTLSSGYYHSDNQVQLVFQSLILESLPHLYDLEVSFPLHSHLLLVESSVSKMIVHTNYVLFRNKSDIIFGPEKQDSRASSPFRFQQVRNIGALAITVEGCSLSGTIVATLTGNSVNLGHHDLKLKECIYSVEIYQLNNGAPPVIASYLPNGDRGLSMEDLLLQPLLAELAPKLQAALISNINTSAIFNDDLPKIRSKQTEVFDEILSLMDDTVRSMNQKTLEKNMGTVDLKDFVIVWDDAFTELPTAKSVTLSKMVLVGLDSLYVSHSGGPVKLTSIEILEEIRFATLQVIGIVTVEGFTEPNEFAIEISDFAFDVTIEEANKIKLQARGWRYVEFSCPAMEFIAVESLVVGFLLKELPERLKSHLLSVYGGEVKLSGNVASYSNEEQAVDGKYFAQTQEINDQHENNNESEDYGNKLHHEDGVDAKAEGEVVKLNHIVAVLPEEDQGEVKIHNIDAEEEPEDPGQVKLNYIAAEGETEDPGQVKLNYIAAEGVAEDEGQVKLHHIAAESHAEDEGKVKLHHIDVEGETEDQGQVKLNYIAAEAHDEDQGQVKLNYIAAEGHDEDQGQVKLHHIAAESEPEDSGDIKIHHIAAEAEPENEGQVKLNYVDIGRTNRKESEDHKQNIQSNVPVKSIEANTKRIKLRRNTTIAKGTKTKKIPKLVGRNRVPVEGKKRNLVKQTRVTNSKGNLTVEHTTHMTDNNIHSS